MGTFPTTLGGPRVVSLGPAWGSPSIQCPPSTVGASGAGWDPRAGLSSPPRRPHTPDGIWGPGERGDRGQGVHRAPQDPPRGFPRQPYLHFLDHFAKGPEEIPGQVPAELPCGDTTISVPSSYRDIPWRRDPGDLNTHRCSSELIQPSHGAPKFGTHHKEPPRW